MIWDEFHVQYYLTLRFAEVNQDREVNKVSDVMHICSCPEELISVHPDREACVSYYNGAGGYAIHKFAMLLN